MFKDLISHNTAQDWSYALLAAAAFILTLHALRRLVLHQLEKVANKTETVIDNFVVDVLSATRVLLTTAIGLYLGSRFLTLSDALGK